MAAGQTYTPIATSTLGSNTATVSFSSFSGYTDLILVSVARHTGSGMVGAYINFNSDTGANYSQTRLYTNGSGSTSDRNASASTIEYNYIGGSNFTPTYVNIMNYSNSISYKPILIKWNSLGNGSASYFLEEICQWKNSSPITTITLTTSSNSYTTGSTFTLYGIKAA